MFCSKCGTEISDEAVICVHCGASVTPANSNPTPPAPAKPQKEDKVSIGLCILSFFIPLFGIIYWALQSKETPKKAKACGITGIVSWVLSFIFSFIFSFVYGILMSMYF